MINLRTKPLTQHNIFQVPLEGTALALGILGVAIGSLGVYCLHLLGLDARPLGPAKLFPLDPSMNPDPGGFLFTFWRWTPKANWIATGVLELGLWCLVSTAIARTVITRVSKNEALGVTNALAFAATRFVRCFSFFGLILGILVLLALPLILPALVGLIPGVGSVLGSILYFLSAAFLYIFALFAVTALLAGFPVGYLFLPAALAAEEGSFLDCATRALGYAFARPFLFLWDLVKVALFAGVLYILGTRVLPWIIDAMPVLYGLLPGSTHPAGLSEFAAAIHKLLIIVIRIITGGFVVAYVFGAGTLMYLNLRQEVDGVDLTGPEPEDPEPGAEA